MSLYVRMIFLFIILLHINDISSAFWKYTNRSRPIARLLKQFLFFVTGTQIASVVIALSRCLYRKLTTPYISLISTVYQKPI